MTKHPSPYAEERAMHPIPVEVRNAVLARAKGRCECCGCIRPLEMHHTTYDLIEVTNYHRDFGDLIFGHETPAVLLALCRDCHLAEHLDINGDFWADPNEKETYWATYWSEMERD